MTGTFCTPVGAQCRFIFGQRDLERSCVRGWAEGLPFENQVTYSFPSRRAGKLQAVCVKSVLRNVLVCWTGRLVTVTIMFPSSSIREETKPLSTNIECHGGDGCSQCPRTLR